MSPEGSGGWCLPSPSGILELGNQQYPTRGGTNGTIHRDGRPRRELHAGGDLADRKRLKDFPVETNGQALVEAVRHDSGPEVSVFEEGLQSACCTRR